MSLIQTSAANCRNCYRCIRSCPVKAIEFKDNQAKVNEECVLCSRCMKECPQKALSATSDLSRVQFLLEQYDRVVVSLAPSYVGYFEHPETLTARLRALGFAEVRETAEAASLVSRLYNEEYGRKGRLITTACPVVVELIEKQYPALISHMAQVDSPMMTHGKMIKQADARTKVVFIGPCYAKKKETIDQPGIIDAVLTFDEVEAIVASGRLGSDEEPLPLIRHERQPSRVYPVEGGVIDTTFSFRRSQEVNRAVSGLESCMDVLGSLTDANNHYFLELNACSGSCINGPVSGDRYGLLEKQDRVYAYMNRPDAPVALPPVEASRLVRFYHNKKRIHPVYTDSQIGAVLEKFGKFTREDELNCGACGFKSCREKAVAVLENKAELSMCMPYMQAKAESMSNIIIERTPNGIITVSEDFLIREMNEAVCRFFEVNKEVIDLPVEMLFSLEEVPLKKGERYVRRIHFAGVGKTAMVTVSFQYDLKLYLIIITDQTERELEKEKVRKVKQETIEMAQRVIDNQMRVSQEIASLLGETTAETKVTMTKLKNLILKD